MIISEAILALIGALLTTDGCRTLEWKKDDCKTALSLDSNVDDKSNTESVDAESVIV
jgi:hypothetical protein